MTSKESAATDTSAANVSGAPPSALFAKGWEAVEDGSEHTLEEVGQSFQVTRERIRQIEAKALRKLRHPSRSRKLKAFVEGVKEM